MHIDIICHCSLYSILSHCFDNLDVLTSPFSLQNLQYIDNSEFPRLADLGAVISGAKNLQCQQVLEELDVCWNWHILVLVTDLEGLVLKRSIFWKHSQIGVCTLQKMWTSKTFCFLASIKLALLNPWIWDCFIQTAFVTLCYLLIQVYKRLKLTLELLKKSMEISKIPVLNSIFYELLMYIRINCKRN